MSLAAAFFDLDRTLIRSSSAPVFARYIADAGITEHHDIPLANLFLKFYEEVGESRLTMAPAKLSVPTASSWFWQQPHPKPSCAHSPMHSDLMM